MRYIFIFHFFPLGIFQYWSIAPAEHLLSRLEIDSDVVSRRIIGLIFQR